MIRDQELAGLAMTLGHDAKIQITVGGNSSYCKPDGSHINIARMPSTPVGRMLMTGLVFHEIGHKNYSTGGRPDGLFGDMMNVIEDIRVDMETIKARPGTCFNLESLTSHYVKKGSLDPKSLPHAMLGKVMAYGFGRLMNHQAILPLEAVCNEMMDDAFGPDFVAEVDAIIQHMPKLRSTRDATVMAQKLIDLLVLQQQQSQKQNQQQGIQQSQNGKKGSSASGNGISKKGTSSQQQSNGKQASGAGGTGAGSGGTKRPTADEIDEMLKTKTGYGDVSALVQKELDAIAAKIPESILTEIPMLPVIGRLHASNGKLDEVEAISASSRMRARLMGLLQSIKRKPETYGLSGRKLAAGRLVRLSTGDPRIFQKKIEKIEVNTAVMVLLDLSGSMSDKFEVANAAAFALHTTLFGLKGVNVCSVEFSGKEQEPEINILVSFGRKPQSENFNHRPFNGTPTHNAIWAGRALLLQRPEPRKIILILTDGCPDNDQETKAATLRTMKDGIEMAAIGIVDTNVRHFWSNHQIINTIQELPAAMFGVMEGLLTSRNLPEKRSQP